MFTSSEPSQKTSASGIKIVLCSRSAIKVNALTLALKNISAKHFIVAVKTKSSVPEQPINNETLLGAKNRINNAMQLEPNADIYIAIENGIFEENNKKIDKAIVVIRYKEINRNDYADRVAYSEGVEFPLDCFNKAKQMGFQTTIVAEVMFKEGFVLSKDDPHSSLGKKIPRAKLLEETINSLGLDEIFNAVLGAKKTFQASSKL